MVPTLDTPIPAGKNAVWSAAFALAWQKVVTDITRGPVRVQGAQDLADRLNAAPPPGESLPGVRYLAAGPSEGVADEIRREMAARFPGVRPEVDAAPGGLLVYGYLAAGLKFTIPYFAETKGLEFKDASGRPTRVRAFGIRAEDEFAYRRLREQVRVLFRKVEGVSNRPREFAIDLDAASKDIQLVVACVPRAATLKEILADVLGREGGGGFGPNDVLLVPEVALSVVHRFQELEGPARRLLNPGCEGLYIDSAQTGIRFTLDKGGADLQAEAAIVFRPIPDLFLCDRPFLIFMRLRGSKDPFFAMWVENEEVLKPGVGEER